MKLEKRTRIFINGFGRIGRCAARIILEDQRIELVGINDIYSHEQMAYLLKYDSIYGKLAKQIELSGKHLLIGEQRIALFSEADPHALAIEPLAVDVVLQCSGVFLTTQSSEVFLQKGVKRVLLSAPASDETPTYIFGVNHQHYANEAIISTSSCSATAIVPIFQMVEQVFGIKGATMSMYHSYTSYQNLLDGKHYSSDIRRTRSATQNIIPLLSSAAKATARFFPHLEGRLSAKSIRIPIASTTLYALTLQLATTPTQTQVNERLRRRVEVDYQGVLDTTTQLYDSSCYTHNPHSATLILPQTQLSGDLLQLWAWQDNEYGYVKRLIDMVGVVTGV